MADNVTGNVKSLKQELREAVLLAQQLSESKGPEFDAAVARAAELRDQINDVNEQIGVLTAGGKFEALSNSIGDVGGKIMSLDFEGARESAERLVQMGKAINFKDAISSVKDLGKTFLNLGKALLTNPLFLIAAVIAVLVIAIVKLMDKIGLLKVITNALGKVFEWIMIPINAIIQGLKDLTDWLGWTNNAAEDAAQAQADAAEKSAKAYEEKSKSVVSGYDHEIRMLELSGKSTREVELKKVYYLNETAKARAKADRLAYQSAKLRGDLDEEELEELRKKMLESKQAYVDSGYAIQETKAKFRAEDKAKEKKAKEDELKAQEDADKKKADASKKAAEDAAKRREEERKARLDAQRLIEDLTIAIMKDGAEKQLAETELKYKRLREANMANSKITAEQRKQIDDFYETQLANDTKAIQDKANAEKLANEQAYLNQLAEINKASNISRKQQLENDYQVQLAGFKKQLDDKLITQEQYNELEKAALNKKNNDIETLNAEYAMRDRVANASMMEDGLTKKLELIAIAREQELAAIDLTEQEKAAITEKYRLEEAAAEEAEAKAKQERAIKTGQMTLDATKGALQGISDIVGAFAGKSISAQKKAFETQKKLNIAMATIDTIKGAVSAFTGFTSQIPGPVGIALGAVAAAGVVASGVANVKKISSTKFEGGGNPSANTGSGAAGSVSSNDAAVPSLSLFGNSTNFNNATGQQSVEANKNTQNINVTVGVDEITNTQNNVNNIIQAGKL